MRSIQRPYLGWRTKHVRYCSYCLGSSCCCTWKQFYTCSFSLPLAYSAACFVWNGLAMGTEDMSLDLKKAARAPMSLWSKLLRSLWDFSLYARASLSPHKRMCLFLPLLLAGSSCCWHLKVCCNDSHQWPAKWHQCHHPDRKGFSCIRLEVLFSISSRNSWPALLCTLFSGQFYLVFLVLCKMTCTAYNNVRKTLEQNQRVMCCKDVLVICINLSL